MSAKLPKGQPNKGFGKGGDQYLKPMPKNGHKQKEGKKEDNGKI